MARSSRGCSREWDRNDSCPALVTPAFEAVDGFDVEWTGVWSPSGAFTALVAEVSSDGVSFEGADEVPLPVSPAGNFFDASIYGGAGDTIFCRVRLTGSASCPDVVSDVLPVLLG